MLKDSAGFKMAINSLKNPKAEPKSMKGIIHSFLSLKPKYKAK